MTPAALTLLQASATTPPRFERLYDLTMRAHLDRQQTRTLARELVKRGLWAVTGREEATRYLITPDGQALLDAVASSEPAQHKRHQEAAL